MPTIIWAKAAKGKDKVPPHMKKKAYAFFEKLSEDDTLPGLHIEKIRGSDDDRVRTGRVDDNFRAVLFKVTGSDEPAYVIYGIWPHDEANRLAERVTLSTNPINGVSEVRYSHADGPLPSQPAPDGTGSAVAASSVHAEEPTAARASTVAEELSWEFPHSAIELHEGLGLDLDLARAACAAHSDAEFSGVVEAAEVEWQQLALISLATGSSIEDIRREFGIDLDVDESGTEDERLVRGLRKTAAKVSFHWIEDHDELRQIVDSGDFGAWRLFLHPEQRAYAIRNWNGPFRLSGGAGTGKTVVAVHRARRLWRDREESRVLLTTYTRNLAEDLTTQLRRLDPGVAVPARKGDPGVTVAGVDQIAWAIVQRGGEEMQSAASEVLGWSAPNMLKGSDSDRMWSTAAAMVADRLSPDLASAEFLRAEYAMVVLPARITSLAGYARVRRRGRGVQLDRAKRALVWEAIEAYRSEARAAESTDFDEKAAMAAEWLQQRRNAGESAQFDHVLVDEAQDLTPSRLRLLRALVDPGRNDLFLCEDSHQRIYGQKVVLADCGIRVVGRSRRLTLNYRTTEQNLQWAMNVLAGGDYTDLEGQEEDHRYRSARSGPVPVLREEAGFGAQLDAAAELVAGWLPTGDGVEQGRAPAPEAIALLVRDKWLRSKVVAGLTERGVEARSLDAEALKPGAPVVMTMHRAKGLEFSHVLLFAPDDEALTAPEESEEARDKALRERSLLYVAATRARDVLAVLRQS